MHARTIIAAIGLLAAPLSLFAAPGATVLQPGAILPAAAPAESSVNGHKLEPAPMPTVGPAGVAPVDRAGGLNSPTAGAGPVESTPFSAAPQGMFSSGSEQVRSPTDATGVPRTLGR